MDPQPPVAAPQTIEIESSVLVIGPGDRVHITAKSFEHSLRNAEEVVGILTRERDRLGRRLRVLVDIRKVRSLSREARQLYQSERTAYAALGVALVIDSGVSRVIGNFFMGLNKGVVRSRLFTDLQAGQAWLDELAND